MGVDSRLITLLFVLIAMPGYVRAHGIDFDADLSFSNGTQLWGREEDEEFEPPSASEFPLWKSSGAGKMPVNVDSFGAVGDGIADDTQAFVSAWERACSLNNAVFLIPEQRIYKVNATKFRGPCQGKLIIQIAGTIVAPEEPRNWDPKNPRVWLVFSNLEGARIQGGGVIDGSGSKWWAASFFFFLFLLVVYIIDSHAEEHQRYSISKLQITADNLVLPMPYSLVIKRIWQISSSKPPGRSPLKICTPCNRPPKLSTLFMAKRTSSRVLHPRRSH